MSDIDKTPDEDREPTGGIDAAHDPSPSGAVIDRGASGVGEGDLGGGGDLGGELDPDDPQSAGG